MSESKEVEYLMISGIQHFVFCRRQWGLIHIDKMWADNYHTILGEQIHEKAHDPFFFEKRNDRLIVRALKVVSHRLKITGECDVVEFIKDNEHGVPIYGRKDLYRPYPIEYKKGKPKLGKEDIVQLAAQTLCLEEMLSCHINEGAIYYAAEKRREVIPITEELRDEVEESFREMHNYYGRQHIPNTRKSKKCKQCSLYDICMPMESNRSVLKYIKDVLESEL